MIDLSLSCHLDQKSSMLVLLSLGGQSDPSQHLRIRIPLLDARVQRPDAMGLTQLGMA